MGWSDIRDVVEKYAIGLFDYLAWSFGDTRGEPDGPIAFDLAQLLIYGVLCMILAIGLHYAIPTGSLPAWDMIAGPLVYRAFTMVIAIGLVFLNLAVGSSARPFYAAADASLRVVPVAALIGTILGLIVFYGVRSGSGHSSLAFNLYVTAYGVTMAVMIIVNLPRALAQRLEISLVRRRLAGISVGGLYLSLALLLLFKRVGAGS